MDSVRRVIRFAAIVAVLLLTTAPAARAAFEDIEVSPRARALGGTWAALRSDVYAPFHNPASLAWVDPIAAGASTVRPFGYDFSSQHVVAVSGALPRNLGGIGLGIRRFGVDYLGESLMSETTISLAHGVRILADVQSELSIGWALNLYALDFGRSVTGIDPGNARSVGINVGATAVLRDRTRIGFQALNLNSPNIGARDKDDLRRCLAVGVSYAPYDGVETVLDVCAESGVALQYRGGAEFQVTDFAWLRTGIHSEPSAFTAGFGIHVRTLSLEYGFSTGGVLEATHQFGISLRHGGH